MKNIQTYCAHDSCPVDGACEHCQKPIIIDRTFADEIKVTLPNGYRQKFWLDLTDQEAINKCEFMRDLGISSY